LDVDVQAQLTGGFRHDPDGRAVGGDGRLWQGFRPAWGYLKADGRLLAISFWHPWPGCMTAATHYPEVATPPTPATSGIGYPLAIRRIARGGQDRQGLRIRSGERKNFGG